MPSQNEIQVIKKQLSREYKDLPGFNGVVLAKDQESIDVYVDSLDVFTQMPNPYHGVKLNPVISQIDVNLKTKDIDVGSLFDRVFLTMPVATVHVGTLAVLYQKAKVGQDGKLIVRDLSFNANSEIGTFQFFEKAETERELYVLQEGRPDDLFIVGSIRASELQVVPLIVTDKATGVTRQMELRFDYTMPNN